MRDIKFQVLWVRNNSDFTKSIECHYTTLDRLTSGDDKFPYRDVEVVAKRQYTGLKDKSGVEIYEGDIFFDGIESCVIEFNELNSAFIANDGFEKHYLGAHVSNYEVIGNIHQNPELLNK